MSERLVIDLDACRDCVECTAQCTYPYHTGAPGVARLRELAAFELACRQCKVRSCVEACPNDALEEQENGVLKRYNMRCTGCLSCSHACAFGNIIPAALQFRDAACDYCAGRADGQPECARTCPEKAIVVEEVADGQAGVYLLGDSLGVRATVWQKKEPAQT
jgi:Fe-S-cluster-containing hydrogenase component 2